MTANPTPAANNPKLDEWKANVSKQLAEQPNALLEALLKAAEKDVAPSALAPDAPSSPSGHA